MKKSILIFGLSALIIGATLTTNTTSLNAANKKTTANEAAAKITLSDAKQAALKHAGLKESDVKFTKTKLDNDDDTLVYDIEFSTSTRKYEYEIDAYNSEIIEYSSKKIKSKTTPSDSKYIGVTAAKKAALKHADLKESDVKFTKAKLTKDDGVYIYDVEFYTNDTEYEYEINAKTGKIIEFDMDTNDMDDDD